MKHESVPYVVTQYAQVNYQFQEGQGYSPVIGTVTHQNDEFLTLAHEANGKYTESHLWWDRVVSVHVLKEKVS